METHTPKFGQASLFLFNDTRNFFIKNLFRYQGLLRFIFWWPRWMNPIGPATGSIVLAIYSLFYLYRKKAILIVVKISKKGNLRSYCQIYTFTSRETGLDYNSILHLYLIILSRLVLCVSSIRLSDFEMIKYRNLFSRYIYYAVKCVQLACVKPLNRWVPILLLFNKAYVTNQSFLFFLFHTRIFIDYQCDSSSKTRCRYQSWYEYINR